MNKRYAIVVDDVIVNMVVWDGVTDWHPAEGYAVLAPDTVSARIGWKYINGEFIDPTQTETGGDEELNMRMSQLAEQLKIDVDRMNLAYLSAIVVDGESEAVKVQKIREELSLRKQKYRDDLAALISEYEGL